MKCRRFVETQEANRRRFVCQHCQDDATVSRQLITYAESFSERTSLETGLQNKQSFQYQVDHNLWIWTVEGCFRGDGYQHFERSRTAFWTRTQMALVGGVSASGLVFWMSRRETIPYTHRRHAILISIQTERQLGKMLFEQVHEIGRSSRLSFLFCRSSNRQSCNGRCFQTITTMSCLSSAVHF